MVQRDGSVVRLPVALGIIPYFSLGNIVVTRANCEQLNDRTLFPMSKSGDNSVAFNPKTRTLTLTDARVAVSSTLAGLGVRSDINLVCMDSSEIVAEGAGAASLLVERACLVDGTGRLIATADGDGMALRLDGSLTLNGGYVKVVGKDRGVSGGNLPLTLNGGTLHAFGKHGHSIDAVGCTVFPALVAHAPKGGSYKGEPINAFVDSEQNPVINAPVIVGVASQSYGFKIGGVEENSHNAQQLGAKTVFPALQEGIISYDRASNALRLVGAHLTPPDGEHALENVTDENLAIHLEGDSVLHATTASSLQVGAKADVKFTTAPGMAPLRLLSSKASAITIASGISLELLGAIHVAIRGRHGILGVGGEGEGLEIARRGSVEINDSEESILRLGSLLFQEGAGILYPYGPLLHSVMLQRKDSEIGGPAVTGYVLIGHNETPLGVELNGVQLTPATLRFHCRRGVVDAGRRRGNSPS